MYECVCVCECVSVSVCNILINAIRFTAWPWAPLRLQRHLVYATMQNVGRLAPSRSHLHAHSLNKWNCVSVAAAAEVAASNSNNNSSEPDVDKQRALLPPLPLALSLCPCTALCPCRWRCLTLTLALSPSHSAGIKDKPQRAFCIFAAYFQGVRNETGIVSLLYVAGLHCCCCHCYCCFCFCCVLTNEISVSHFDCLVSSLSIRGWGGGCLFVSKQAQLFNVIGKCEHAHVFVFVWETQRVWERVSAGKRVNNSNNPPLQQIYYSAL